MTAYSEASITSFDLSSNIQPGTAYTFTKGNDNPLQYDRGIASYYGCGQWNEKNYALCKVMLEVWKANTDLAQYGYLNMNLEETFKDTIGIEVSIAIHKLNNTSVSIKDVDKAIETELKEALNTITQLTE